ncbi:uncharacterized protein TM35_000301440 [Trypanosoma theileri]|uniref:Leucine-rich repeat protein (LRRP) n=1 Tax=Trypanosoma theileri TaxID=67003 RepID=A0A1X0NN18_9TRYP|nr:uncharacterized protein TM35_000301440 [Trypanosoma theileri]ORC86104.1 hypothetical protein TM35_000301440 [Trypanosoma theileri]
MLELSEIAPFDLNMEKVEQMVMHINSKCASLQRQVALSSQNQSVSCKDIHTDSISSEVKFQLPSTQDESAVTASHSGTPHSTHSLKTRSVTYWSERELFVASSELCQYLNGGVDYRAISLQLQRVMEILLTLLREDLQLAREIDVLPGGTVDRIFTVFSDLFREGKNLLTVNGVLQSDSRFFEQRGSQSTAVLEENQQQQQQQPSAMMNSQSPPDSQNNGKRSNGKQGLHVTIFNENEDSSKSEEEYEPLHLNTCGSALVGEDSGFRFPVATPKDDVISIRQSSSVGMNTQSSIGESNGSPLKPKGTSSDTKSRYQRMEELYDTYWKSDGMDMIADMMQMVFLKEYEQNVNKTAQKEDFSRFKKDLDERIMPGLKDYDTFQLYTLDPSTLRSDYVVNCLHNHVKPNEKILDMLTTPSLWRETPSLVLSNVNLGDAGVKSFAPLLPRLKHIRLLDLSSNDIHDTGISELCTGLLKHPTLEALDISHNPITDVSGNAILHLATQCPHLKVIRHEGITFNPSAEEVLAQRLERNRRATNPPWLPPGFVGGHAVYDRGDLWRPVLSTRLAPLITPTSTISLEHPTSKGNVESSQRNAVTPNYTHNSTMPRSLGVLQRVRLPYRTAQLGNIRASRRESKSSPR